MCHYILLVSATLNHRLSPVPERSRRHRFLFFLKILKIA
jgi:hypothetical protein